MVRLSHEYFESLIKHAIPLDDRALAALSGNAMALGRVLLAGATPLADRMGTAGLYSVVAAQGAVRLALMAGWTISSRSSCGRCGRFIASMQAHGST